jgi:hypothetical protein
MVRRRLDAHLEAEISRTIALYPDWTPAQVHAHINRGAVPERISRRTIVRRLKEARRDEQSRRWTFTDSEPEDAALVLATVRSDTVASATDFPGEGLRPLTRAEAEWVIRLKRAYPELAEHEGLVRSLAGWLVSDPPLRDPMELYEEFLAWTPWRDGGAAMWEAFRRLATSWEVIVLAYWLYVNTGLPALLHDRLVEIVGADAIDGDHLVFGLPEEVSAGLRAFQGRSIDRLYEAMRGAR